MEKQSRDWNRWMIDQLQRDGVLQTERLARALKEVPRTGFVPPRIYVTESNHSEAGWIDFDPTREAHLEIVHNRPLIMKKDGEKPLSVFPNPAVVPTMLEALDVQPEHRVLDIGTASGYQTALLSWLVGPNGQVVSLDIDDDLVKRARENLDQHHLPDNVRLESADGWYGFEAEAPYDRIVMNASCYDLSPHWLQQLKKKGRLLVPLQKTSLGSVLGIDKRNDDHPAQFRADLSFQSLRSDRHPGDETARTDTLANRLERAGLDPVPVDTEESIPRYYDRFLGLSVEIALLGDRAFHTYCQTEAGPRRVIGFHDREAGGIAYFHDGRLWHDGHSTPRKLARNALQSHAERGFPAIYEYRFQFQIHESDRSHEFPGDRSVSFQHGILIDRSSFN